MPANIAPISDTWIPLLLEKGSRALYFAKFFAKGLQCPICQDKYKIRN